MKHALVATLVLGLGAGALLAQDHQNTTEKTVKQTITLPTDTQVGGQTLKAGSYRVICDRETIVFQQKGREIAKVECRGPELSEPASRNEVHTRAGEGGVRVLTRLLLKGSNVRHEFQ
jgi:hypothetical protein